MRRTVALLLGLEPTLILTAALLLSLGKRTVQAILVKLLLRFVVQGLSEKREVFSGAQDGADLLLGRGQGVHRDAGLTRVPLTASLRGDVDIDVVPLRPRIEDVHAVLAQPLVLHPDAVVALMHYRTPSWVIPEEYIAQEDVRRLHLLENGSVNGVLLGVL